MELDDAGADRPTMVQSGHFSSDRWAVGSVVGWTQFVQINPVAVGGEVRRLGQGRATLQTRREADTGGVGIE